MKIFLTESEVLELAYDALDLCQPDSDHVHDIALKMDMVYNEYLDLYEDVEEISLGKYNRRLHQISSICSTCKGTVVKDYI